MTSTNTFLAFVDESKSTAKKGVDYTLWSGHHSGRRNNGPVRVADIDIAVGGAAAAGQPPPQPQPLPPTSLPLVGGGGGDGHHSRQFRQVATAAKYETQM